eukprot:TRINITY_DN1040_c0_g1_i1.p1 TRINITY_DN1040_c0_g1~~TRINITY_DN1040_c0_g1_i1.p1  ORF type:complete len:238 (-),score=68.87 TRINITY_DN1040_c0_g1_i1:1200-1913(-)
MGMKRSRTCINIQELVEAPKRCRSSPNLTICKGALPGGAGVGGVVAPPYFKVPVQGLAIGSAKKFWSQNSSSANSNMTKADSTSDLLLARLRSVNLRSSGASTASLRYSMESFPIIEHPKEDFEDEEEGSIETLVPAFSHNRFSYSANGSSSGSACGVDSVFCPAFAHHRGYGGGGGCSSSCECDGDTACGSPFASGLFDPCCGASSGSDADIGLCIDAFSGEEDNADGCLVSGLVS